MLAAFDFDSINMIVGTCRKVNLLSLQLVSPVFDGIYTAQCLFGRPPHPTCIRETNELIQILCKIRSLIKSYGASKAGDKIQRSTVLIDKEGRVAAVWNPVRTG